MNQDEILEVLEQVSAGNDVAENEIELPRIFITDTEVYRRLLRDEIDLITGGKGTGKSAMYRMITETPIAADIAVLTATNPTGAPEFLALFRGNDSEERLRSIWVVYFASLLGNYVVDKYGITSGVESEVSELQEILQSLGLRKKVGPGPSLLARIRKATTVEGQLKAGLTGLNIGVGLKFDLGEDTDGHGQSTILNYPDFYSILRSSAEILEANGDRVWIAMDRLDECFVRNSATERRALRALLRASLNISQALDYTSWVRLKIFLRTDLFSRFTEDGAFTNATHLRRGDISWTFNSMADLIGHRLTQSSELFKSRVSDASHLNNSKSTWDALLPDMGPKIRHTSQELCLWTCDGSGLYNPRNLITLINLSLNRARENQRRAISTGRASRSERPLVNFGEVNAAAGELARRRFQDTVVNEFPEVQPLADKLANGPNEYISKQELMLRVGGTANELPETTDTISLLLLSGLVGQTSSGGYRIPRLYRSALRTSRLNGDPSKKIGH
ncbi:P-loop ATPase, Sll1717 family [Rathayibacter sp. AY1B8]|uniref:P-loop ATPase, Sll1717 family n=1 Tax=Rathayibacter sp. AY1B8 TaxID=2080533 RepID=UPI0011B0ED7F|nr:hypothetical protein [Rathayibacter sp. AY1B8]